jgi:succinate-semialdehyde dehydrogenase/glutarate-semialdehyde dehydrogenase
VADIISSRLEELARLLTSEAGKPLSEARGEWQSSADLFDWFAEEGKRAYGRTIPARKAGKRLLSIPAPVGVVATITAWNFPAYLPARKWSAALAAGCTVVGRPSEITPLSAMALTEIIHEAGIPAGVMNLVNGDPGPMGEAFLESPYVDKLSFTGSQRVGRILMRGAADHFKRLSLELGGSAPVLIFPDVDVRVTAQQAVLAKFRNSGQVCVSPARYYVHSDIADEFVTEAAAATEELVVGNGLEEGVTTGPLSTADARERVEGFVHDAVAQGAKLVVGGSRPGHLSRGYFFEPTVLTGVLPMMRVSCEEVFGPVMPVATFSTMEEALQLANDTPFGLAGYVMTRDLSWATRVYEGLKFGIVGVNDFVPATAEGPFGGVRESGFGREGSQEGLREYLETKFVSIGL